MNPTDYYRLKSAEITEADIRLVAAWYYGKLPALVTEWKESK